MADAAGGDTCGAEAGGDRGAWWAAGGDRGAWWAEAAGAGGVRLAGVVGGFSAAFGTDPLERSGVWGLVGLAERVTGGGTLPLGRASSSALGPAGGALAPAGFRRVRGEGPL